MSICSVSRGFFGFLLIHIFSAPLRFLLKPVLQLTPITQQYVWEAVPGAAGDETVKYALLHWKATYKIYCSKYEKAINIWGWSISWIVTTAPIFLHFIQYTVHVWCSPRRLCRFRNRHGVILRRRMQIQRPAMNDGTLAKRMGENSRETREEMYGD